MFCRTYRAEILLTPVLAPALRTRPSEISEHARLYAPHFVRLELKRLHAHQQQVERAATEIGDAVVLDVLIVGELIKRQGHAQ
jgi:hypothetical protein